MSTIDLNKLCVRKKFFIPCKSSVLNEIILEQLKLGLHIWDIAIKRPRSGTVRWNWEEEWAHMCCIDENLPRTTPNLAKYRLEFNIDALENLNKLITRWMDNIPYKIHFVVAEERIEGCVCEVTCFPMIYLKILRKLKVKYDEAGLQDARLQSEEFLVDIFVGGLGGKEIVERREVPRWELLINDVDCHHITDRINQMLSRATAEILLMGWVGTNCLPKLKELKNQGLTIQAVTHKPSERKAPVPKDIQQGYTNLVKILGTNNVSTNRELHGRAILVDNKALIGSMDFNSPSLSGEHREFAVYTEDINTVRTIRAYFKKIFVPLKQDE